jgi:polar amino acid transport system substrate-binding protein
MKTAKSLCIGCTAAFLSGGMAQAQEACTTYTVVAGDNLRSIARSAYGNADLFRVIYRANVDVIGPKADLILIGERLTIPCDPNAPAATEVAAAASAPAVEPASTPLQQGVVDPAKQPVEIVPELPTVTTGTGGLAVAEPTGEPPKVAEPLVETVTVAPAVEPSPEPDAEPEAAVVAEPAPEVAPEPAPEPAPVVVATAPEPEPEPQPEMAAAVPEAAPEPAPEVTAAAAPAADSAATAGAPMSAPVRMVTGNGFAPYADEMLPGGGMFTQLVEMAIFRADPAIPYNMTFISDWQAHIDALLPSQAYDISFPWVRPDCTAAMLSPGDQARCDDFVFSAPFYEMVDGFFAPADSELIGATDYAAFKGKRICRPEGYTTGVLDAVGLSAPEVELLRPIEVTDCFEALASGQVDLVAIDAEVGDSAIAQLGLVGRFAQNPHLMTLQSLHAIAHKSNPRAVEMIVQLDSGLVEMYESGEWYDIVSTALSQNMLRQ